MIMKEEGEEEGEEEDEEEEEDACTSTYMAWPT